MKKKDIVSLIKYHTEQNEAGFREQAYQIAKEFDSTGDSLLAQYVMSLIAGSRPSFSNDTDKYEGFFLERIESKSEDMLLPFAIEKDIKGIMNTASKKIGVNRFLFQGYPGTGKTEAAKLIATKLKRQLYMVDFATIIDSKLGQTQKNMKALFDEIARLEDPSRAIILFDEIDALALDRTNQNDLREMGRTTSSLLKYIERLDDQILLIATTNLYQHFDKALIRRFDAVISFNRYSKEDLIAAGEKLLDIQLRKFKMPNRNRKTFRKILECPEGIPYPGDLRNIIKTSIAFSNPLDDNDYLRLLYSKVNGNSPIEEELIKQNFTKRERELLLNTAGGETE